ncbi:hypothetical protein CVT26_000571 [Gymnopilus dilepis]|uniref:Uncharacterized protein n=1 Tax=Gymnopilus dilepis TaxID=231916 RepID=A0A409VH93_9AGAR|nr:hypothetical protein CVT26_000571 [Gymnopilus dilepis]
MSTESLVEPLLRVDAKRYALFPIQYHSIWRYHKTQLTWTKWSIDTEEDRKIWRTVVPLAKKQALIFYLDLLIYGQKRMFEDLLHAIRRRVTAPEVRCALEYQAVRDNVHVEALYQLRKVFVNESDSDLVKHNETVLEVLLAEKFGWTFNRSHESTTFTDCLITMGVAKRVFSASLYSVVVWIADVNEFVLPGLVKTIRLIQDDVMDQVEFAALLLMHLQRQPSRDQVLSTVYEARDIEIRFANNVISYDEIDPNAYWVTKDHMCRYIVYLSLTFVDCLGYGTRSPLTEYPFPWMDHVEGGATAFYLKEAMEDAYVDHEDVEKKNSSSNTEGQATGNSQSRDCSSHDTLDRTDEYIDGGHAMEL